MVINNNLSASMAGLHLNRANSKHSTSSQRLSTGLRINSAKDDAAGLAISKKLNAQVLGTQQASRNSADGISVVQTADGALNEIHSMIHRARELSIQAATDTLSTEDKEKIMMEIDQVKLEINSLSSRTEFNKINLLNGDLDLFVTADNGRIVDVSDTVESGDYKINSINAATNTIHRTATPLGQLSFPSASLAGNISINGQTITITEDDTEEDVLVKIGKCAALSKIEISRGTNGALIGSFESIYMGSRHNIEIYSSNTSLLDAIGINSNSRNIQGRDAEVELVTNTMDSTSSISNTATYTADGDRITITDVNNKRIVVDLNLQSSIVSVPATSILNDLSAIRDKIGEQMQIINDVHTRLLTISSGLSSIADIDLIDIAVEVEELATDAYDASQVVIDLINDLVVRYPEVVNYAAFAGYQSALNHDSHLFPSLQNVRDFTDDAITAASSSDFTNARDSLADSLNPGYVNSGYGALGNLGTGSGVSGCTFLIASRAFDIIQDTIIEVPELTRVISPQTTIRVRDNGLILHTGANENMIVKLVIPKISTETLGMDRLDCKTQASAQEAIGYCDDAMSRLSEIRAKLGAYQNRLEYTITNLDTTDINSQTSLSRIQDTDMALEMSQLTRHQVISQAGTSILAQANTRPQQILQILQ